MKHERHDPSELITLQPGFEDNSSSSDKPAFVPVGCSQCRNRQPLDIGISMAFQPIVDIRERAIFGYEALVRGTRQEPAGVVLGKVNEANLYSFDQTCRVTAIDLAARLGLQGILSINFLPNAVYRPETCIRATLEAAAEANFPLDKLMFEVTEGEKVTDVPHLKGIFEAYQRQGFITAIDDFGAGHSGLNLLAEFQPDVLKLDMALTRGLDSDRVRQAMVRHLFNLCNELGIRVIAEGVETRDECRALEDAGVSLVQGYYFARPAFEALPTPALDELLG